MTRREIILNEIQKVRNKFYKYNNIKFQNDDDFEGILKLFGLQNSKKDIYFFIYTKVDNVSYRFFVYYLNNTYSEIFTQDYELVGSSGFDHILSDASFFGKAFIQGATFGILRSKTVQSVDFKNISVDTSEIYNVVFVKGILSFMLKDNKGRVDLETKFIKEKENNNLFFQTLATLLKDISLELNKKDKEFNEAYTKILELFKEDKLSESLSIIDKYLAKDNEDFTLHFYKAIALHDTEQPIEAQRHIELSLSLFQEIFGSLEESERWDDEIFSLYAELKDANSKINYELKNCERALWEVNDAYFLTRNTSDKAEYKESREEILNSFMGDISNLEFHKRRIIYIEKELPSFKPETILPLRIDRLESFVFPPSHPLKGELYVGHPLQPNYYYPLDEYEQLLFESQFVELNHLLQCLGASEIRSERIKGSLEFNESEMKSSNKSDAHFNQKVEGGNKLQSGNLERDLERKSSEEDEQYYKNRSEKGKRMVSIQRLTPQKAPYTPEGLVWYNHNETWQKLAQQRLQGGLNYYEMIISSNSVRVINEREKSKINSDYKMLISGGYKNAIVNSKGSKESEKKTETEKDIMNALNKEDTNEWKLIVDFAPVEELASETISLDTDIQNTPAIETAEYNENELKYIDDIKFAIEDDGIIDDDERRMLERNQARYKISEERAKELEDEVLKQNEYTAEELEFIEELNFILDHDGDIDDGDRRILLRLASRLDITELRAKELEEGVLMSREASTEFTEQEQEYIKELNFCLEEGPEISRSARRLLDRVVESLGISEERAREIEEEIQAKLCDSEND